MREAENANGRGGRKKIGKGEKKKARGERDEGEKVE